MAPPPPLSGGAPGLGDPIVFGVLTVSDRASAGTYEDEGGPAILGFFAEAIASELSEKEKRERVSVNLRSLTLSGQAEALLPAETTPALSHAPPLSLSPFFRWTALYRVIPDDQAAIETELKRLTDEEGCSVVVTTGGTGPAPRDVTPDATAAVCDRLMPGYGEQMRAISLRAVPTAVLSRQTAGVRGSCLILNLPGRPRAIRETIDEVWASVPYCVDLLGGPYHATVEGVVRAFRPAGAVRKAGGG